MKNIILYILLLVSWCLTAQTGRFPFYLCTQIDSAAPPDHNVVINFGNGTPTDVDIYHFLSYKDTTINGSGAAYFVTDYDPWIIWEPAEVVDPNTIKIVRMRIKRLTSEWAGEVRYRRGGNLSDEVAIYLPAPTVNTWVIIEGDLSDHADFMLENTIRLRFDITSYEDEIFIIDWITLNNE